MRSYTYLLIYFFYCFIIPDKAKAQMAVQQNAAEIARGFEKLNVLGSVLYFAAHPDDENTRLIAWLSKEQLYRTGYLSLTRGDGGQNLIGSEQGEELGLIRTQELLAARRTDGGEQFFSTANDFGFSKTFDETFEIWGKEKILANAVWVIRKFRPDIIITRFPGDERAGHGHHQASSLIAQEAFVAAADPNRFPEQLKYTEPWQAKRLLWNTFNFGSANTIRPDQFKVDIGHFNALLGTSYGELAAKSRNWHKSQGFGSTVYRGAASEYFELLAGDAPKTSLMDGVTTSWQRVEGSGAVQQTIKEAIDSYDIHAPQKSVGILAQLIAQLKEMPQSYWVVEKTEEAKELLLSCAGLFFEADSPRPKIAVGENGLVYNDFVLQQPDVDVEIVSINGERQSVKLEYNKNTRIESSFIPKSTTQPYWLENGHSLGAFTVKRLQDLGLPESGDLPHVTTVLKVNGIELEYKKFIFYKYTDPVRGEVYQPLVVSPEISGNASQRALVFGNQGDRDIVLSLKAHKDKVKGMLQPVLPQGWHSEPASIELDLLEEDDEENVSFKLFPPSSTSLTDSLAFSFNGDTLKAYHAIRYDHIPMVTWFPTTKVRLSQVITGVSAQRIGYLMGAGDLVPQALREIGLRVDLLSENDVLYTDLSVYDAIVTGVRLYNVNDRMRYMQPKLLAYVEQGGTLVEQYNVNNGLKLEQLGPYPFSLSRNRVTEEDAVVGFAKADSQVLHYPNAIIAADFDGWIQERGLYFAGNVDKRYEQPLIMNDKGEAPLSGSLLVAPYGKGKYVYTSLSFFRQLPAGVPGAYRLFVNLLAKKTE
ncbi:PIG-L family deacetylase [Olivibacter sitiensis]|uniref:PIG-L family deacetylase n=1 Tax=Olivibacter sitiensis TaxID=376470 RepID=UPI00040F2E07|nr:PIG-L family deacetylase [Olivibacter sitiensis]